MRCRDGELDSLESIGGGFEFERIVVLVNGRTASAAEVFAQSLREITGAVIIGSQTFGKGLAQSSINLESGNVALMTMFEILSSDGMSFHAVGVAPDISVSPLFENIEREALEPLNFVNSASIRRGADNRAVLALNQRLARIGYISPDYITSELTDKTIAAVEIFQRFNNLSRGISNIDFKFIEILNDRVRFAPRSYEPSDTVLNHAIEYILDN